MSNKCLGIPEEDCQQESIEGMQYCNTHSQQRSAEIARFKGLRTIPKPGDPDCLKKDE